MPPSSYSHWLINVSIVSGIRSCILVLLRVLALMVIIISIAILLLFLIVTSSITFRLLIRRAIVTLARTGHFSWIFVLKVGGWRRRVLFSSLTMSFSSLRLMRNSSAYLAAPTARSMNLRRHV